MNARSLLAAVAAAWIAAASPFAHAVPISVLPEAAPSGGGPAAAREYGRGLEALTRNDLDAADRAFAAAVAADRRFVPGVLGRAEVAGRRNEIDRAGELLAEAARLAPADAHVQASLGRYYAVQRDYAKAETALTLAYRADPQLVAARMDLADLYATALGKPEQAIALYRETVQLVPQHAGAHYALGVVLADRDGDESARMLARAAELDPTNPLPATALGRLSLRRNDARQALQWADAALRIDPSYVAATLVRTDALFAGGDSAAALDAATALARQHERNADVQFQLATLSHLAGRLPQAFDAYRRVSELAPGNAVSWNNLAALALEIGTPAPATAVEWARKAKELAPTEAQFLDTLGWALHRAGDHERAATELVSASGHAPGDAGVWYHLGVVYDELGRDTDAASALRRALALDGEFFAAADARARLATLGR